MLALCDTLIAEKIGMRFKISARVDTVDPEMLDRLHLAGCYRIHYGVESGVQRLLDYLDKGVSLAQIRQAFAMTRRAGIETYAYIMFGIPTETLDDIRATRRFVDELRPNHVNFAVCTPFPKTRLYEMQLEASPDATDYWAEFARAPHPGFFIPTMHGQLPIACVRQQQDRALRRFYGRPDRIWREFWRIRSFRQLSLKVALGARILLPRGLL